MQVKTHPVGERWERRSYNRGPEGSDGHSEGIKRVEKFVFQQFASYDAIHHSSKVEIEWKGKWFVPNFTIGRHNTGVGTVTARVISYEVASCHSLLFSPRDIAIERTGCSFHDFGKMLAKNRFYKEPRGLTPEEFVRKNDHSGDGARLLLWILQRNPDYFQLTPADWDYLSYVFEIMAYHHKPSLASSSYSRSLCVRAKCVDSWVARREDRHTPGLSPEEALKGLRTEIETHPDFLPVQAEAMHVADIIDELYVSIPTQQEVDEERDSKSR